MSFSDMLKRPMKEMKRPPLLPAGIYLCQMEKFPVTRNMNDNWESVDCPFQVIEADAVDEGELEEFGNVVGKRITMNFILPRHEEATDNYLESIAMAEVRMREFLDKLGVDVEEKELGEGFMDAVGAQVLLEVEHNPDKDDPEKVYLQVKRSYAVN